MVLLHFSVKLFLNIPLNVLNRFHLQTIRKSCPNVSTTPLQQWGFRQCLLFSWTTLRGEHCRHPIAVMGVVDAFEQYESGEQVNFIRNISLHNIVVPNDFYFPIRKDTRHKQDIIPLFIKRVHNKQDIRYVTCLEENVSRDKKKVWPSSRRLVCSTLLSMVILQYKYLLNATFLEELLGLCVAFWTGPSGSVTLLRGATVAARAPKPDKTPITRRHGDTSATVFYFTAVLPVLPPLAPLLLYCYAQP